MKYSKELCSLLQEENSLMEIVKLIGSDVLPDDQKLVIETARVIESDSYNRTHSMPTTLTFRLKSSLR